MRGKGQADLKRKKMKQNHLLTYLSRQFVSTFEQSHNKISIADTAGITATGYEYPEQTGGIKVTFPIHLSMRQAKKSNEERNSIYEVSLTPSRTWKWKDAMPFVQSFREHPYFLAEIILNRAGEEFFSWYDENAQETLYEGFRQHCSCGSFGCRHIDILAREFCDRVDLSNFEAFYPKSLRIDETWNNLYHFNPRDLAKYPSGGEDFAGLRETEAVPFPARWTIRKDVRIADLLPDPRGLHEFRLGPALLPENPELNGGEYSAEIEKHFSEIRKETDSYRGAILDDAEKSGVGVKIDQKTEMVMVAEPGVKGEKTVLGAAVRKAGSPIPEMLSPRDLKISLLRIEKQDIDSYHPSVRLAWVAIRSAMLLITKGLIIPEITSFVTDSDDEGLAVSWVHAPSSRVRKFIADCEALTKPGFLCYKSRFGGFRGLTTAKIRKSGKGAFERVLDLMIEGIVSDLSDSSVQNSEEKPLPFVRGIFSGRGFNEPGDVSGESLSVRTLLGVFDGFRIFSGPDLLLKFTMSKDSSQLFLRAFVQKDGTDWPLDGGKSGPLPEEAEADAGKKDDAGGAADDSKDGEQADDSGNGASRRKRKSPAKGLTLEETVAAYVKLVALGQTRLFRYVSLSACFESEPGETVAAVEGGEKVLSFATASAPLLAGTTGVTIELPEELSSIDYPEPIATISASDEDLEETDLRLRQDPSFSVSELLHFDWKIAIGNEVLSEQEFMNHTNGASGLIKIRNKLVFIDKSQMEKLRRNLQESSKVSQAAILRASFQQEFRGYQVHLDGSVRKLMERLGEKSDIAVPSELKAKLRPYQAEGYRWLYKNTRLSFGSIIADDMGLGKTIQVICLLLRLRDDGRFRERKGLVIVPAGLIYNWLDEFRRFAPDLKVQVHHGPDRTFGEIDKNDVLLTTYGTARSDQNKINKRVWEIIIIDEAQNIKNVATAQTTAVKCFKGRCRIAMTGTPVENRLQEFWSIMDFVNPGYLSTRQAFNDEFGKPIQKDRSEPKIEQFKRVTSPFLIRRLKTDRSIITDLPDKIEQNEYATLTPEQAALYQETIKKYMEAIRGITATDHESLFKRSGIVLQMILYLKEICNHPAQYLHNRDKLKSLRSGKVQNLESLLDRIIEAGEKALVFTQFKEMGFILQDILEKERGYKPLFFHGSCSLDERRKMVKEFQEDPEKKVFIISLKAGGTGLNLTAASHVIHFDLWWNPAVEAQATDRAYRIGQHSNVIVHRFITKNTFEEKIDQLIQSKRELAELTVNVGENWVGNMSNRELEELFKFTGSGTDGEEQ